MGLCAITGAVALYGVFVFFYLVWLRLFYPYGVGLGEAPVFQATEMLGRGVWPYRDLSTPPFSLVPYGPVYLWLTSLAHSWLGGGPFVAGRLITATATVGVSVMIAMTLRQMGVSRVFACLAGATFLFHKYTQNWSVMVNVDMTGVFLDLLAFYFYSLALLKGPTQKRWLGLGIAISALAFFTKSSMIAAPAAFFLILLSQKRWREVFSLSVCLGSIVIVTLLYLNHVTAGQYWFHTTEISHRLFFKEFIGIYWWDAFRTGPVLVIGSAAYFVYRFFQKRVDYFFVYALLAFVLTLSLGKQGSDTNYLLQCTALSCVMVGIFLKEIRWIPLLLLAAQLTMWVPAYGNIALSKKDFEKREKFYDHVSAIVKQVPGKVLSMDMSLLVANGKEVFYEPFPMGQMSYSGLWDDRLITDRLDKKEFSLALLFFLAPKLRADRNFTKNFMTAFNRNYRLTAYQELPTSSNEAKQFLFFYEPIR